MFGGSRRRRPQTTTPLYSVTANPNATTAAATAFMSAANPNPNKSLSSAAAAAALRARPDTPTNVAAVQTKRTARRSASVSSSRNGPVGSQHRNGYPQLERRGSSSSMSDRTFRSPSPHGSSTPVSREQRPPVPQIPDSHKKSTANSRTPGVGMQNFLTASQKIGDETHSWYGQPAGDTSNVRRSDNIMRTTVSPPPMPPNIPTAQPTRPDSRGSVNFSYPTVFRPQSPPASPTSPRLPSSPLNSTNKPPASSRTQASQQLVYDPNSRRMVPKAQIDGAAEYQIKQAAVKAPKRRREGGTQREGSQLAKGTVSRVKGTLVEENKSRSERPKQKPPVVDTLPAAEEIPSSARPAVTTETITQAESTQPSEPLKSAHRIPSPSAHQASQEQGGDYQLNRSVQTPSPAVQDEIEEFDESIEMDNQTQPSQSVLGALDAVPTRQALYKEPPSQLPSSQPSHQEPVKMARYVPTWNGSGSPEVSRQQANQFAENRPVVELAAKMSDVKRSDSMSPARQARFAPGPAENLAVRHAPLPRSASPIKSALKHSSPIARTTSPSDNISDPPGSGAVSPHQREDSVVSRRKSVRVSFDDQGPIIVGEASPAVEDDSTVSQSPQSHKRGWLSTIGRTKKKEIALDDDDEVMKPRPALPSFGSIRDKKSREPDERPLVRPLGPSYLPTSSSPERRPQSSSTLNDSETTEEASLGQSSDHAIGALLVQDDSSPVAANISRFREPLPPVVTSVEGNGYSTDSLQSSDNEEPPGSIMEASASSLIPSTQATQLTQSDIDDNTWDAPTAAETSGTKQHIPAQVTVMRPEGIPRISIVQASPMASEHDIRGDGASGTQNFDIPGGFPDYESDVSYDGGVQVADDSAADDSLSSDANIFEPAGVALQPYQAGFLPQTTLDTTMPITDLDDTASEDQSEASIYSDAYEDIPDIDSSGFMSLDAIVDSPMEKIMPKIERTSGTSPNTAIPQEPEHAPFSEDQAIRQAQLTLPQDANDWEQAKAFWRSLTAERRRQLELEAAEESGADGDREEILQPVRRTSSKRKSSEQTQSAIQPPSAQGGVAQPVRHQGSSSSEMTRAASKAGQELQSASPKQSNMRMSLRGEQNNMTATTQPQTGMRKTMRTNGAAQGVVKPSTRQPTSTRTPAPPSAISNRNQAAKSAAKPRTQPSGFASPDKDATRQQARSSLQRRGSDASESSFKRSRPAPGGAFAFRQTMRQTSPPQSPAEHAMGSGRFSLRSLSPAGSTRLHESTTGFAAAPTGNMMNRTLRANSESSHERKRLSGNFSMFGRSTKASPKGVGRPSRFEDSSDEDEVTPVFFRSRIDDSSDEEGDRPSSSREARFLGRGTMRGSATLPNLSRPAPVPELEEDSPDLPDSDDQMMPSPLQSPQSRMTNGGFAGRPGLSRPNSGAIGTYTLGRTRSGRGGIATSFNPPEVSTKDRRGSFMNILRRNKKADQGGKIQRPELMESAARRDTKLERDAGQLKEIRGEASSSPKLHKRGAVSRSDSGGLVPRPTSAGNLLGQSATTGEMERPTLVDRRSVSLGFQKKVESYDDKGSVAGSSMPKKKKFGALRRMFKLDD